MSNDITSSPPQLSNADELLYRQVHPNLLDGDQPASSVFLPNPGDKGQLSTDRSSLTSARDAYALYVSNNRKSIGTYGLTVGEFGAERLNCYPDPLGPTAVAKANPAHARVDYSGLVSGQQKKAAKRLKQVAIARGILHKP